MKLKISKLPTIYAKWSFRILFMMCLSLNAFAAQWATVTSNKAIIYADPQMSAEIGFIRKGKNIRVGEVIKNKGMVLPIVINKRIAYIKVKDIITSSSLDDVKEVVHRGESEKVEITSLTQLQIFGSSQLAKMKFIPFNDLGSDNIEVAQDLIFLGGGFRFSTFNIKKRTELRMGFEYLTTSKDKTEFSLLNINGDYALPIIYTKFLKFKYYVGFHFVPVIQYKASDFFKVNGHGYGAQAGLEVSFAISEKLALHVDGGYYYTQIKGLQIPVINEKPKINFTPNFSSFKFTAGVSYQF